MRAVVNHQLLNLKWKDYRLVRIERLLAMGTEERKAAIKASSSTKPVVSEFDGISQFIKPK